MPWQKGESGNPKGRRVDQPFKGALNIELAISIATKNGDEKKLRVIARNVVDIAADKDHPDCLKAAIFIAEKLDGKVPQAVVTSDDDGVLTRHWVTWIKDASDNSYRQPAIEHDDKPN